MAEMAVPVVPRAPRSSWTRMLPSVRRHRGAMTGMGIVTLLILIAFGQGVLAPQSATKIDITAALRAPDQVHWMGTDQYGRDVYSLSLIHI